MHALIDILATFAGDLSMFYLMTRVAVFLMQKIMS